ncbi:filamentous hemagglutinin N-terminal domain-containing protein, partial [Ralstonia sp. 1138]|uniref:beta strand repeat-containing protein n=1 Tax=Ralstonia sp. 1138 TaxID=3156423 RepID=UPI003390A3D6
MNRIYRLVFSKSRGAIVAVAENTSAQGKGSRGERGAVVGASTAAGVGLSALSAAAMLLLGGPAMAAGALPQGGTVVGGQATIGQPNANQMLIQQGSQRAAINWQSFNVGAGNSVQFVQPSASAQVLNRVIGMSGSSQILGTLTANGQVYIVNPQGVVFGKGSVVNAGALLASTKDIDPARFMSEGGRSLFLSGGSNGSGLVQNDGSLSAAPGGWIVLAGDAVKNTGSINAPGGKVGLLAGGEATLALNGGSLVNVQLNASQAQAAIDNSGSIKAAGGTVLLNANTANTLLGSAINLSGVVDVSGAQGGRIDVDAGAGGLANLSGATLNAAGTNGAGGNVTVLGNHVGLFQGTHIDASGATGGGTVLVGGDFQGKGSLRKADATVMDASSSIDASAKGNGNGGTVGLWSDSYTQFNGNVLAQGGAQGGNGGHVDTSSAGQLGALGQVSANAAHGANGMWTLDPSNITVSSAADANYTPWFTPTGNPVTVNNGSLSTALQGGTSVTLNASNGTGGAGWINVAADIASTGSGNLTLLAANGQNVTIGANISLGSGSFTAAGGAGAAGANGATWAAGGVGGAGGNVIVNSGATITAANVTLLGGDGGAAGQSGVGGAAGSAGGAGGQVIVNGNVVATAGTVTIKGGAGGGGGGGGGCGTAWPAQPASQNGCGGGTGGVGGAGGAVQVAGMVNASGAVSIAGGNGGGGGGAGGGGWGYQIASGPGGNGGAGGAGGAVTFSNASVTAGGAISVATGSGGGGGGGGGGQTTSVRGPGQNGVSGTTGGGGGAGGAGSGGSGSAGGAGGGLGTNGGSGANGSSGAYVAGNSGSGSGGAGGAGAQTITVNGTSTLTGASLSLTNVSPVVINGNMVVNTSGATTIANNISGPGFYTQASPHTSTLTGTVTLSGGINILAGGAVNVTGNWTPSNGVANVNMSNGSSFAAANITAANTNVTGTGNITLVGVNTSANLSANTTGNLILGGALVSRGGNVTLVAGSGGTSGLANGTDTAGDVQLFSTATIALPTNGTLTVYTGNDNLRALDAVVTGGTGATTYATYNATLG